MSFLHSVKNGLARTPLRRLVVECRHVGLSEADVFLASFPKTGNTWLKFMLTHLLTGEEAPDTLTTDRYVPSIGQHFFSRRVIPSGGRIIKTHERYRNCYHRAIFIVRDGRDVAVSYYSHVQRMRKMRMPFHEYLLTYLEGKIGGFGAWHEHAKSWLDSGLTTDSNKIVVRYEDLLSRCAPELQRICDFLNIDASEQKIREVIAANEFQQMKRREARGGLGIVGGEKDGLTFVRKGTSGDWVNHFSDKDLRYFMELSGNVMKEFGYT